MNISQPVLSAIAGVDFGFLSSDEIKALSVKRITNPTTFDSLLHPTPGGLYDPALGAFLDNRCSTCQLKGSYNCPGHCGHIELPTPVYHPTFMDQCLRLMRSKCIFCHRLKMRRIDIHLHQCKLLLIDAGLLNEASKLDDIRVDEQDAEAHGANDAGSDADSNTNIESDETVKLREAFVRKHLKRARSATSRQHNIESLVEARRDVIRELLASMTKQKKCGSCDGISPGFRKDRYVKIFRKVLQPKEHAHNVQVGVRAQNPLMVLNKRHRKAEKAKSNTKSRDEGMIDEGVADMDISSQEEDLEDAEESEGEESDEELGTLVVGEAATRSRKKTGKSAKSNAQQVYVSATEVRAALVLLFETEKDILQLIYSPRSTLRKNFAAVTADMFFIDTLLVPPTRFRPEGKSGDDAITESPTNTLYKGILNVCDTINQVHREMKGEKTESDRPPRGIAELHTAFVQLQDAVNSLIDRDRNPIQGAAGRRNEDGIKQVLEKKEGLFRMNMMGKRVNFAARSVISPDPNIETNEIGVPPVFAMKLTYPEPVTSHNFYELKEAVINGPNKWPGAIAIENENGQIVNLKHKNAEERLALANQLLAPSTVMVNMSRNKKVHRHLNNGDVVIMNRQPTLHKPSMMAHRARVLPGEKTIRMHYANCNTYNADFDGDEMNMHFPQNEVARAEAVTVADTDHQYLSGTAGKPLRGLIQDHISICVQLTNKDIFFNREDYQQLLYAAIRPENNHTTTGTIVTVPPAILRPVPVWTGKQVITTILKNITPPGQSGLNLSSKSQTSASLWGEGSEEQNVIFSGGELVCGILDKAQIGPSAGGFVHSVYEAYGPTAAGRLLSMLGRMLTKVLHMRAHSCGVEDLILTRKGEKKRKEKLKRADALGLEVASKFVSLADSNPSSDDPELKRRLEGVLRKDEDQKNLDEVTRSRTVDLTSEITKALLPEKLVKPFPRNQMQTMTSTGAKGSQVNANLISCNLGQQVLEGRRVPTMVSGKTLPSFKPFDPSIRAGGYITQRFLTGIKPQEYFFHAMAGREGLIDTAVKTSRSGYLQRCLIKGMEGLTVTYDNSVRDADGTMIQFLYGEDGLDVAKQRNLKEFKFAAENFSALMGGLNVGEEFKKVYSVEAGKYNLNTLKEVKKTSSIGESVPDPALSIWNPGVHAGSTSEKFLGAFRDFCHQNPDHVLKEKKDKMSKAENDKEEKRLTKKGLETLLNIKYLQSVVDPGEAVGVIAGQSVGEPSTQMTLNTFHLAGHSAKNVTLGIPRLREIVMTASRSILTPAMSVYLNPALNEEEGQKLAKTLNRLSLAEVIDKVNLHERIEKGVAYDRARRYEVRLDFYPAEEYEEEHFITANDVLDAVSSRLLPNFQASLKKVMKKLGDEKALKKTTDSMPEIGKSAGRVEEQPVRPEAEDDGGSDDGEDDDGDATNAKQRQNRKEAISYAEADDDEEAIATRARREDGVEEAMEGNDSDNEEGPSRAVTRGPEDSQDRPASQHSRIGNKDPTDLARSVKEIKGNADLADFTFAPSGDSCTFTLEYSAATPKILALPILEKSLRDTVIQAIPGLTSCHYEKELPYKNVATGEETKMPGLLISGVNLKALWDFQEFIDPDLILTNDIHAMLMHYGVEAARATLIAELDAVFTGHAIAVDNRHLNLIADYMTRGGGYKAFNRTGMRDGASPLGKMSFETTVGFLKDSVLEGGRDDLRSPSARLVVGRLSKVGTGAFDVLVPAVDNPGFREES